MPRVACLNPPADVSTNDGTTYSFTEEDDTTDMPTRHAEVITFMSDFELA